MARRPYGTPGLQWRLLAGVGLAAVLATPPAPAAPGAERPPFRTAVSLPLGARPTSLATTRHPRAGEILAVGTTRGIVLADLSGGQARVLQLADDVAPVTALAVGDLTGDGVPDLTVASGRAGRVRLYRGTARGYFVSPRHVAGVDGVRILTASDQAVYAGGRNGIVHLGPSPRGPRARLLSSVPVEDIAVADLDGNGRLDLVTATGGQELRLLFDVQGPGRPLLRRLPTLPGAHRVAASDVDGDGRAEILVAGDQGIAVHFRDAAGWFGAATLVLPDTAATEVAATDLDRDGHGELAVLAGREGTVVVLAPGPAGATAPPATASYRAGRTVLALAGGDWDDDGETDLATLDPANDRVVVLRGLGHGRLQAPVAVRTGSRDVSAVVAADLDGDHDDDLVTASRSASVVTVHSSNGDGVFRALQPVAVGGGPRALAAADFDADGFPDIAVALYEADRVVFLRNDGRGILRPAGSVAVPAAPAALAAAALDGDPFPDLAVGSAVARRLTVLYGDGRGGIGRRKELALPLSPRFLLAGDRDGDGYPDLVAGNRHQAVVAVARGGPDGIEDLAPSSVGDRIEPSIAADFDADGTLDLAVPEPVGLGVAFLRGLPRGGFAAPVTAWIGHRPDVLVDGDFNGDGLPDLAAADAGTGTVTILLNVAAAPRTLDSSGSAGTFAP